MNHRQLECVITLAEEKSFSEAAKKLGISQPSLSQFIQKIEEECGNELFERSLPLKLTYAGTVFVQHAKTIMQSQKQMRDILADVSKEEAGKIVVGAGPLNSMAFLPPFVRQYREKFPKVEIVLEEYPEKELGIRAEDGMFDLVITAQKVNEKKFEYLPLFEEKVVLAIRGDHPFAKAHPTDEKGEAILNAKDCLDLEFLEMNAEFPIQKCLKNIFDRFQREPKYVMKCGSIMTGYALVRNGVGAMLLPTGAISQNRDPNMCYYSLTPEPEIRIFGVYYLKGKYISRALQEFIDLLKQAEQAKK